MRGLILTASLCLLAAVGRAQATPQRVEIVVASTTDVHGRIRGWDYYADAVDSARGLSRAATIVDSLRQANPGRVLLVDAGDLLQGNPFDYVAARLDTAGEHPVIAAMNAMRYDAAAVGNHEFNYGLPTLRAALSRARFPFLAANVTAIGAERGRRPLFSPYRIIERAGVRVGVVGATTPGAAIWDQQNLSGRLRFGDIVPAVKRTVAEVRRRGVDAVIVVMHSGLDDRSSYDTASTGVPSENVAARVGREVPGIDLVVFGHTHREVADSVINGVRMMQPRNWATSVGVATLTLERSGRRWRVTSSTGRVLPVARHAEHPAVVAVAQRVHASTLAWVNQTLGTTHASWRADSSRVVDTPLIDFILETQRRASGADLASTAAFDLNASLDTGRITIAEVARLYPYDNTLRAIRVSGRQLREFLEYSARYYRQAGTPQAAQSLVDPTVPGFNFDIIAGADYVLDISRPIGQRVTKLEVRGVAVKDSDSFTLALNNYRQTGGGGYAMLQGAPVVYDRQVEIRDLLIDEVRRRGELRPEDFHRVNWRLAPEGIADTAYQAMRRLPFDRSTAPARPTVTAGSPHLASGRWLRVIGTNDLHGALEATDFAAEGVVRGGLASLVTAIRQARAECVAPACVSLWVDGGDQWQGSPASNASYGRPVVEVLNGAGLAAAALGNHDLDWSPDTLRARMRSARYSILAANVRDSLGRDVEWLPGDTLIDLGGVKVGVVGATTVETMTAQRAVNLAGMRVVDAAEPVSARVRDLRRRGADAVVLVAHIGAACDRQLTTCSGEAVALLQRLTDRVDAMVAGHSHRGAVTVVNGTPLTEAYQRGSAIGIIDIPLGGGPARSALRNVRPDSTPGDSAVAAYVHGVTAPVRERFARRVATMAEDVHRGDDGRMGELIADAQRAALNADVAVMNTGGVRADLRAGPVTYGDVFQTQPFDNTLVKFTVNGAALRRYLERICSGRSLRFHLSGVSVVVDTTRAAGQRLMSATLDGGRAIDDGATYTLVMNDFMAQGGDGMSLGEQAMRTESTSILDRDALADFLGARPQPVVPPSSSRVRRVPQ